MPEDPAAEVNELGGREVVLARAAGNGGYYYLYRADFSFTTVCRTTLPFL